MTINVKESSRTFEADTDTLWVDDEGKLHFNFLCKHQNVEVGYERSVYCPDCENEDLTDAQVDEILDA